VLCVSIVVCYVDAIYCYLSNILMCCPIPDSTKTIFLEIHKPRHTQVCYLLVFQILWVRGLHCLRSSSLWPALEEFRDWEGILNPNFFLAHPSICHSNIIPHYVNVACLGTKLVQYFNLHPRQPRPQVLTKPSTINR